MDTPLPDEATVLAALALAARAPSIHNTQPLAWRIGDGTVHLYADSERHLPHTDPARRDLILSCGATLQHFTIALAALGWHIHVHRLPNAGEPEHLASVEICGREAPSSPITEPLEVPSTRDLVRTTVLDRDCVPQMLLRIGWAPLNADPLPATARRPLTEVVRRLDGTPID